MQLGQNGAAGQPTLRQILQPSPPARAAISAALRATLLLHIAQAAFGVTD